MVAAMIGIATMRFVYGCAPLQARLRVTVQSWAAAEVGRLRDKLPGLRNKHTLMPHRPTAAPSVGFAGRIVSRVFGHVQRDALGDLTPVGDSVG
jgi:hypothetical protein